MSEFRPDGGSQADQPTHWTVSSPASRRRQPKNRSQQSLRRPARESYATRTVEFDSDGETCVGTLYLPSGVENPPVIVMAPGLGVPRSTGLPAVAERFAEAGYAAFCFDFRHFGDSDGQPRRLVRPSKQVADYGAAIDRMQQIDAVDSSRTILWGYSLSGGHVLTVAADRFRLAGVIAVTPFVDGRAMLRRGLREPQTLLKSTVAGLRDTIGRKVGLEYNVPLVAEPDEFGVITAPGAKRAIFDAVDREAAWNNELPASVFLALSRYRPIETARKIGCPTLVIGARNDQIVPASGPEAAAAAIADATYIALPADHMSVISEDFEAAVGHQLTFLHTQVAGNEE